MPDFCENCGHSEIDYEEPNNIGDNIPKKSNPSRFPQKYRCMLGHKMTLNKDKQIVPYTKDYTCDDFIKK